MAHPPLIFRRLIGGSHPKITNDNNTERRRIYSSAKRAVGPFNLRCLLWPMPHGTARAKTVGKRTSLPIGNVAMENL
jgi:hypothetical protein